MIEFPKVLHAGFHNCLKRLQEMDNFAFEHYIAPGLSTPWVAIELTTAPLNGRSSIRPKPPNYAMQPGFSYNLMSVGISKHDESLRGLTTTRLTGDANIEVLRSKTIFDHGQAAALHHCLLNDFAFVQGPPGSGKTFMGTHLTRVLLASRQSTKPILVVCLTNHALDSFLGGLKDAGVEALLRIGSGSKEEWTEAINLRTLNRKNRFSENEIHKKFGLKHTQQIAFANIQEWCDAQSSSTLSGKSSWYAVREIVATDSPDLFEQFQNLGDSSYLKVNMYEFWAGGGDISKIRLLKFALSSARDEKKKPKACAADSQDGSDEIL